MFEKMIAATGAAIHSVFVPVVHAEQKEVQRTTNEETVWDRLKVVAHINEYNQLSPELANFISLTQGGLLMGATIGGLIHSKNRYMDFMERATASKYKWHMDAKADLSTRMIGGAVRGAYTWGIRSLAVSTAFAFLVNLIPVLRNEHSIIEYVVSGVVSGTLAGHLFADRDALGFEKTTKPKRMTYKQLCLLRGVGYGLLLGIVSGVYVTTSKTHSTATEIRKWEKYWKQRRQRIKETEDTKSG